MNSLFWVLAGVIIISSGILLLIDYNNSVLDKKSKATLVRGAVIVATGALLAAALYSHIPQWLIGSAAMLALVWFGRYLTRQAAGRKL